MTPITRIGRLRDYGVFRDFTWTGDLPEFARYNLIYGWNWSGKTTLSRLFHALESRTTPPNGLVTLTIEGRDLSNEDFREVTLPVRVFNRDFVAESVFPTGGGDVPPIFVIGREDVEKQREADRLRATLAAEQTKLATNRQKKTAAETALDQFCIERARVIKDTLRSSGPNPYNNYNKSYFQNRAQKMVADGDAGSHRLSESDRENLLVKHQATAKPEVREVAYGLPSLCRLADSVSELLATTVVSTAIQTLKDDVTLSEWTRQGLGLHQERSADKCLFCGQPLPDGCLAAIEAHFSAEYERFLLRIEEQIGQLKAAYRDAQELKLPNRSELYDDLAPGYGIAEQELREAVDATKQFLNTLVGSLTHKKARAFDRLALDVAVPGLDATVVDRLNRIVREHNRACGDFQSRAEVARQRLEAASVADNLEKFTQLRDGVRASEIAANDAVAEVERLSLEIARLEREIVEHRQPAEELNEDLHQYLGHDELRFEIKNTGYMIMRHNVPADSLSEGEMTAIALLYFLKSLQDRRFDMTRGVVVLDDPVSSLDANALYFAFGFIRERTQNAAQLVILTHNFTFFRQVRNWFHHLKGQNKKDANDRPARFFMIDCTQEHDGRHAAIRPLDPLLEHYESEYHYLFAYIYRVAKAPRQACLEASYMLPNPARRLLEAFLAFRQPQMSGELWQKLTAVHFNDAKKTRILRFLHTYSHSADFGGVEHDPSLLSEAHSILSDLLDMIRSQDPDHFAAMVELVEPASEEGDDT